MIVIIIVIVITIALLIIVVGIISSTNSAMDTSVLSILTLAKFIHMTRDIVKYWIVVMNTSVLILIIKIYCISITRFNTIIIVSSCDYNLWLSNKRPPIFYNILIVILDIPSILFSTHTMWWSIIQWTPQSKFIHTIGAIYTILSLIEINLYF